MSAIAIVLLVVAALLVGFAVVIDRSEKKRVDLLFRSAGQPVEPPRQDRDPR